jgi:hypothetical protein
MSKRVLKAEEVDAIRKFYAGSAIVHDLCDTIEELRDEIHEWEESDKAGPVFTSIIDEQNVEVSRLTQERDALHEALRKLCLEATGFVGMADPSVHGYTNINVLKHWIENGKEALARTQSTPVVADFATTQCDECNGTGIVHKYGLGIDHEAACRCVWGSTLVAEPQAERYIPGSRIPWSDTRPIKKPEEGR